MTGSVEKITTSVSELLDDLLLEAERLVGKPGPLMNKVERLKAITYLNEKGLFLSLNLQRRLQSILIFLSLLFIVI